MAERRAKLNEERAEQNDKLLSDKILEMTRLQSTVSQQSRVSLLFP